jgi:hypothetical protein
MGAESCRQYKEYAEECLRWVDEADTDQHRELFLNIAKALMQAALRIEGLLVPQTKSFAAR